MAGHSARASIVTGFVAVVCCGDCGPGAMVAAVLPGENFVTVSGRRWHCLAWMAVSPL
jgi:hypothetical protein